MKHYLLVFLSIFSGLLGWSQGDSPCTAVSMSVNSGAACGAYTAGTTVGATYSNNAANGGTPTCASPGAPDVWYSFVAPASGNINIYTTPGTITDGGMQLYASSNNLCTGTLTAYNCDDDSGPGFMPQLSLCGLTPGNRYWLRIWQYGGSGTGTFNICFWDSYSSTPASTNCTGGTQVCSNASFSGNGVGFGVQELNSCNQGCLTAGEHNSSWYWINVGTTGSLEMVIAPSNATDDYDFAIWGPVNTCPPVANPIRCNYAAFPRVAGCGTNTNPTGMTAAGIGTSATACQNRPYLTPLNVNAGEIYILLIDGYTASSQPFNLTWAGTSTLSCTPIVLPVELLYFTGKSQGHKTLLEWETSSEINSDYFTVEKSTDAINFTEFKRVKAAGMSSQHRKYKIFDNEPFSGGTYYRLKQTDFDGQVKTYNTVNVSTCANGCADASVYSNDFGGLVVDLYSSEEKYYSMKIFDVLGNKLKSETYYLQKGNSSFVLDISTLNAGVYFITFENGEDVITQKFYIK